MRVIISTILSLAALGPAQESSYTGSTPEQLSVVSSQLSEKNSSTDNGQRTTPTGEPLQSVISRHGTATIDDAYRLFLSMAIQNGRAKLDGNVEDAQFDDIADTLRELGIIGNWSYAPDTHLRRDILAYMGCQFLGYRTGILTGLIGTTPRYAHRELQFRRIMGGGAPVGLVSGSELLSVSSRISKRATPTDNATLTDDEIH